MKLTQATSDQLVAKTNGVFALVLGIIFFVVGIGAAGYVFISHSTPTFYIVAGVFAVIGALIAVFASSQTMTFVKSGTSTIETKRLIGGKTKTTQFNSTDVATLRFSSSIQYSTQTTNNQTTTSRERVSNLSVVLKDTSEIAIASDRRGISSLNGISLTSGASPLEKQGQQIASFFGVQLVVNDQSLSLASVGNVIGEISSLMHPSETSAAPQSSAPQVPVTPAATPVTASTAPASYASFTSTSFAAPAEAPAPSVPTQPAAPNTNTTGTERPQSVQVQPRPESPIVPSDRGTL